jgi:DNA-binding transcriptional ArsR family regulator
MLSPTEHKRLENYVQDMDVRRLSTAFDALGEPNRCLIFRALLKSPYANVSQLADIVGISHSLASQHLKTLREADLINRRKAGKEVHYDINVADPLVCALQAVVED